MTRTRSLLAAAVLALAGAAGCGSADPRGAHVTRAA
jgi:hypothetical protein